MRRKNFKTWFDLGSAQVPAQVKFEDRINERASIGPSGLIVRLNHAHSDDHISRMLTKYITWASDKLQQKPELLAHFVRKDYNSTRTLQVGKFTYQVVVDEVPSLTAHKASRNGLSIRIGLIKDSPEHIKNKAVKTLLSRIVGMHQKPWLVRRVIELNDQTFKRPIRNVTLKYNKSNWGSCSSGSNLNFSTRLLFAPPEVIDYVIIHELAHLVELNHSDRFWAEVARVMPEYKIHEQWLKKNSTLCDF